MIKRIKDLEPSDVKKHCNKRTCNIEMGYCAGCPFRIGSVMCLTILFVVDGSMRTDITTRNELGVLREFKEKFKDRLEEELYI